LWIDELEKALGGIGGSEHDGGTTQRVFGTLLTWMQETQSPIYVVATANDVRSLRPELLRRFDDLVFVDLPNQEDRCEILSVHLARRGRTPADFDLDAVAAACWGFTGAEIEKAVKSALELAFTNDRELAIQDLLFAAANIIPIAVTMKSQIDDLRAWAAGRALPAGAPLEPISAATPTRQSVSHRTLDL
jgi:SpoVK/Ycf46/Vps4 family AAA+-type ATPase